MGNPTPWRWHGMLPFLVQPLREFAALVEDEPVDVVLENLKNSINTTSTRIYE